MSPAYEADEENERILKALQQRAQRRIDAERKANREKIAKQGKAVAKQAKAIKDNGKKK